MILFRLRNKFLRFLIVGSINTLFSYTVYAILIFLRVHYSIAIFMANGLGVLFSFKTTGKLVFKSSDNRLIFKFIIVYAVIYLLSVSGVKILLDLSMNKYIAGALIALPMAIISFTLNKKFVFTKSNKVLT